ncbi:LD-carboxypeptidase [Paenibacillus sp. BR2-3]|uniref:LD-carboxypeptidase n=1 Tax=Paenibacillus sp. BR2-3 TaxID=3048494 RepID=UPI00397763FA
MAAAASSFCTWQGWYFDSSWANSRTQDIHSAFRDPNVKGILTTLGGHNCSQLLRKLDCSLIAANRERSLCRAWKTPSSL